jgi:hypothetical protein
MHNDAIHQLLVARQPLAELERKQKKALRRGLYTVEDLDCAKRRALVRWRHIFAVTPKRLPR